MRISQARAHRLHLLDSFGKVLVAGGGVVVAAIVPACLIVSTVAELAMVVWLLAFGTKGDGSAAPSNATSRGA